MLSIMAYSLSASLASISNSFFHTPLLAQREKRVCILIGSPKRSGKIPPGDAGPITVNHRLYKQPIVLGRYPHMPFTSGQNILDPVPLIVPKGVAAHLSALNQLTAYESRDNLLGNLEGSVRSRSREGAASAYNATSLKPD